jgi:hypothetical protein
MPAHPAPNPEPANTLAGLPEALATAEARMSPSRNALKHGAWLPELELALQYVKSAKRLLDGLDPLPPRKHRLTCIKGWKA